MRSVPDFLRPRRAFGALVAIAAIGLAGCGASADDTAAAGAATRSVTDATGTAVDVPERPARVVALSEQDLDGALALGVTPVATVNGRGQQRPPAYLGVRAASIAVVGGVAAPAIDKVIAAEPDLVLAGSVADPQVLAQLRRVAPTVVTYTPAEDWKTAFRRLGDALGRSAEATRWLAGYDTKAAAAATALGPAAGSEVGLVRWNPQGPGIMQKSHFASLVLADLGLKRPTGQQEPGFAHSEPLSLENLDRIDADWIFLGTLNPEATAALEQARAAPAFRQLRAVRAGRLVVVEGTAWTSRGGPLAALKVIEDVTKATASA